MAPPRAPVLRWAFIVAMAGEAALISLQAWRGVLSHFNETNAFDAWVFQVMGFLIVVNTIAAFVLLVRLVFTLRPGTPRAMLSASASGCCCSSWPAGWAA